jgi:hypothetical protein
MFIGGGSNQSAYGKSASHAATICHTHPCTRPIGPTLLLKPLTGRGKEQKKERKKERN